MQDVIFQDIGLIDYKAAWDYQEKLFSNAVEIKQQNRELPDHKKIPPKHYFLLCEHPHVFTLGKSGSENNLLANSNVLKENNAAFYKINRGGDITYHGPGQIVGYPILDLDCFFTDIHKYLRFLEQIINATLKEYNIEAGRLKGATGVWLDANDHKKARKICAMGVRCSRWVTMHGFAFNVHPDLKYFNHIIPCGISDKQVTSMEKELKYCPSVLEVKEKIKNNFKKHFNVELVKFSETSQVNLY